MDNRKTKVLIIMLLTIGIIQLAIGFAAFSTMLNISSSLKITPDSSYFKVYFSSSPTELVTNKITPTKSESKIVATDAIIDNTDDPTITNIYAVFTEPGQYIEYSFYSYNSGKYLAYLNEVNFKNIDGDTVTKKCTPLIGAREDLVQAVCGDIELSIQVGPTLFKSTDNNINSHTLARETSENIKVKITYINNDHWADGDFEVSFGNITLDYGTVD